MVDAHHGSVADTSKVLVQCWNYQTEKVVHVNLKDVLQRRICAVALGEVAIGWVPNYIAEKLMGW
jgi:hypothetical protein